MYRLVALRTYAVGRTGALAALAHGICIATADLGPRDAALSVLALLSSTQRSELHEAGGTHRGPAQSSLITPPLGSTLAPFLLFSLFSDTDTRNLLIACTDCDLKVMHKSVSRHHADIVLEANAQGQQKLLVTDLSKVLMAHTYGIQIVRCELCCV